MTIKEQYQNKKGISMTIEELLDLMIAAQAAENVKEQAKKGGNQPLIQWDDLLIDDDFLRRNLGRKWKKQAEHLAVLFTHCLKAPNKDYFELSVYDKKLIKIFGQAMTVSRTIKAACNLGIMACVDTSFVFGAKTKKKNHSRMYAINTKAAKAFLNVLHNKWIKADDDKNDEKTAPQTGRATITANSKGDSFIHQSLCTHYITHSQDCKMPYKTRGKSGKCVYYTAPEQDTPQAIVDFYTAFPFLGDYQRQAHAVNSTYYSAYPALCSAWLPTLSDGDNVGFRATSGACQSKKGEERQDLIFSPYFGEGKAVYEYDVKASIYAVTRLIHTGVWTSDDVDLYSLISPIDLTPARRKAFKLLCQMIYFAPHWGRVGANVCHHLRLARAGAATEIQAIVDGIRARMIDVIGAIKGKQIFVYESCIYSRVLARLLNEGHKVVQVYDCFYVDNAAAVERVKELLPEVARECLQDFFPAVDDGEQEVKQDEVKEEEQEKKEKMEYIRQTEEEFERIWQAHKASLRGIIKTRLDAGEIIEGMDFRRKDNPLNQIYVPLPVNDPVLNALRERARKQKEQEEQAKKKPVEVKPVKPAPTKAELEAFIHSGALHGVDSREF